MKKIISLLILMLFFTPCTFAIGAKSTMEDILSSWVNFSIDDVINSWGHPTSENTIAGHKVYYWSSGVAKVEGFIRDYEMDACTRVLEVDTNNIVKKYSWNGSACPINHITGKKWINPNNNIWDRDKKKTK